MSLLTYQCDLDEAKYFLYKIIIRSVDAGKQEWLNEKVRLLEKSFTERDFYLAFSTTSRFLGKEILKLNEEDLSEAGKIRKGFSPQNFSVDQASRILFTLHIPLENKDRFFKILDTVFSTAEVNELAALYSALPLLPYPEGLRARCAEGIRTNMTVVFEAIALNNPYPADYLEEGAWNQMVLKSIFTERPLYKIYGLDERSNENLARMLTDYAHERWAAKRYVTPELWRPVAPFLNDVVMKDMERLFEEKNGFSKEAAALACYSSQLPAAQQMLNEHADLQKEIEQQELSWEKIGQEWLKHKN